MTISFDNLPEAVDKIFSRLDQIESLIKEKVQTSEPDPVLGISEAAELMRLTPQTIYTLVHRREIPHSKKGNRLYFLKSDLLQYMKSGRRKTVQEIKA